MVGLLYARVVSVVPHPVGRHKVDHVGEVDSKKVEQMVLSKFKHHGHELLVVELRPGPQLKLRIGSDRVGGPCASGSEQ